VIPVAPPHVRPSVSFDGFNRGDDDLTYKYVSIIKANNMLMGAKKTGHTDIKIHELEEALQYHVATLIDNQVRAWLACTVMLLAARGSRVPCRAVPCRAVPCRAVPGRAVQGRFT
jgi:DNA-directed RNA polymerase beta' subunit